MVKENSVHSMYIHIPFCDSICSYCDFCKMFYNKRIVLKYLQALEDEMDKIYNGDNIDTLYIGGGTPSSLDLSELEYLFRILKKLNKSLTCEFTFEANIDSLSNEKIDFLKENGVNRISIGVETTNEKFYELLNRKTNKKRLEDIIKYLKNVGITNINLDLMYAFSGEVGNDVLNDLKFLLSLDVSHISTYSLILEKNTMLFINNTKEIDQNKDRSMYDLIRKILTDAGYIHYEISNFSKHGYQSRHNMRYWNNEKYYGIGLGSSGYINNIRYTNTRSINNYIKGNFRLEEEIIDLKTDIENEIMLNLRTKRGIDKNKFKKKFNKNILDIIDIKSLVSSSILIDDGEFLKINQDYFYVLNTILIEILDSINLNQ